MRKQAEWQKEIEERTSQEGERPQDLFWPNRERTKKLYRVYRELMGLNAGAHIIELGCGYGWFLEDLIEEYQTPSTYLGFDKSQGCVDKCNAKFDLEVFDRAILVRRFHQADLSDPDGWVAVTEAAEGLGQKQAEVIAPGLAMFFEPDSFAELVGYMLDDTNVHAFTFDYLLKGAYQGSLEPHSIDDFVEPIMAEIPDVTVTVKFATDFEACFVRVVPGDTL